MRAPTVIASSAVATSLAAAASLAAAVAASLAAVVLLAGCTQSGTGVELLIDAGSLTLDRLHIIASYDGNAVAHDVGVVATSTLDIVAQLPDESTTVTFDVTAFSASVAVGHGLSSPIAVTPHHLAQAMITLAPGGGGGADGGDDLATAPPIDLAGTGALWSHQQGALPPVAGAIRGLWASSGTDVYAVGTATSGANAFHSSDHGMHWSPQLANGGGDLNAVAGTSSSDVYLVGDNATILHGSGTSWTAQSNPAPAATRLLAIWAVAPMDSSMSPAAATPSCTRPAAAGSRRRSSAPPSCAACGASPATSGPSAPAARSRSRPKAAPGAPRPAARPTSCAPSSAPAPDLWVVGDGIVLHSDGSGTWTAATDGVPADVNLLAVGGRPGGPVWAVGNAWTIVRRDTSAWVVEPTGLVVKIPAGDVLQAIFAPSSAEVFAGGAGQTILHRP